MCEWAHIETTHSARTGTFGAKFDNFHTRTHSCFKSKHVLRRKTNKSVPFEYTVTLFNVLLIFIVALWQRLIMEVQVI